MKTNPSEKLSDAIEDLFLSKPNNKCINAEDGAHLIDTLVNFVDRALDKYIKGQKEHGGSITDRDCYEDLRNELIDSIIYHSAMHWPRGKDIKGNCDSRKQKQSKGNRKTRRTIPVSDSPKDMERPFSIDFWEGYKSEDHKRD